MRSGGQAFRRAKDGLAERSRTSVVFLARQISLNRPLAPKMILTSQLTNETDVKRCYTDAEAAANLIHSLPPTALPRRGGPAFLPYSTGGRPNTHDSLKSGTDRFGLIDGNRSVALFASTCGSATHA
jgi:hypothetical protein